MTPDDVDGIEADVERTRRGPHDAQRVTTVSRHSPTTCDADVDALGAPDAIVLAPRPTGWTSDPTVATFARALRVAYACGADMETIIGRRLDDRDRVEHFAAWLVGRGERTKRAAVDGCSTGDSRGIGTT